jgi:hypothetical protein
MIASSEVVVVTKGLRESIVPSGFEEETGSGNPRIRPSEIRQYRVCPRAEHFALQFSLKSQLCGSGSVESVQLGAQGFPYVRIVTNGANQLRNRHFAEFERVGIVLRKS